MTYTQTQRREYLRMADRIGAAWMSLFGNDPAFYSAAYWDLLTALWLAGGPMRKTDALRAMKAVRSMHTAGKYLEEAVRKGVVVERANPDDQRSRLVALSPEARDRLDGFLDSATDEVLGAARAIDPA